MAKSKKVKSVPQRNLMGYAYACATGKVDDCPAPIQKVAASFMKGGKKGLAKLRKLAKTKHVGLSPVAITENKILKFNEFIVEELFFEKDEDDESSEVIHFLYSLSDDEITLLVNEFIVTDKETKKEYIEDIIYTLKSMGYKIPIQELEWIETNLKKRTK
jgi:hypothetical protein